MRLHRCAAFLALAFSAAAQQDMGVITGVVSDPSGAPVPAARILVTNAETNETRTAQSSETGAYTVGPLRIGVYNLSVERAGFRTSTWKGLVLHAQDRLRADVPLEIGQISESVSVTSETPLLQAETSSLAHVVEQREIRGLPLNGRNFQQLAWLTAGVAPSTGGRDRESGFNAHGQAMTQNSFLVDGVDNNNNVMGMQDRKMQVVVPSLDAVAEFKVQTSNYSAEFGRNSGAVMIVSIKSGTNRFHGTAFEYLRNNIFDARDKFTYVDRTGDGKADPEVLKQNQFGGTLGGPVRKDRTFFFASWERRTERRAQSDTAVVPTVAERNGVFDPALRVIRDPAGNQPFPNNTVPRSRWDSTSEKVLPLWPVPNFGGFGTRTNYISSPAWTTDRDAIDTRVDHSLSNSDKIFGRFSFSRRDNLRGSVFEQPARGGAGNDRAFDDDDARSAVFSWTKIITPALLNEFRYGFNRQKVDKREISRQLLGELARQYGIQGIPASDRLYGLPRVSLGGSFAYEGLGEPGSMPNFKISQVHQYLDNFSWTRGNHNIKFGADVRWNRSDIFGGASSHGNFSFDGSFTGISLADYLLGSVTSVNLTTQLYGQMRFQNYMFYALDDWKLTPRLTLNVGLRYELTTPWYDKHNNMNRLEIEDQSRFGQITRGGYCGESWSCRGLVNTDTNNWAPRIGLAYQFAARTILRAGGGVFYAGQGSLGADGRGINNFPYNRSVTSVSTPTAPAIRFQNGIPAGFLGDASGPPPNNLNWNAWQTNFPAPTIYQWNVALQRELLKDLSLTVAYVGSSSNYLMESYNWNGSAPGSPATEVQRRRIPKWNNINLYSPLGHSSYHGMDVNLERRYAAGFSLTASYTWSHSIDNISEQFGPGGGGLSDFRNFRLSRGHSNFDLRHRFVAAAVYELPFARGKGWTNALFGGWQLSAIPSMQTGHYFTLTVANARQRLGATGIGNWWPDRLRDPRLANPTAERWFDTSAFALPRAADGTWLIGNAGRSILATDGLFNLDTGLMKNFRLTERFNLQFRGEVFNTTNTPTLAEPNSNIESPDFGKVRSTSSVPRQMQFALRLSF